MGVSVASANEDGFVAAASDQHRNVTKRRSSALVVISADEAGILATLRQVHMANSGSNRSVFYAFEHSGRWWRCLYANRCTVCRSQHAEEINDYLFRQWTAGEVRRAVGYEQDEISDSEVWRHARNHLPSRAWLASAKSVELGMRLGASIEEAVSATHSGEKLAHLLVDKIFVAVATDQIELKVSDGMVAARFIQDLELRHKIGISGEVYSDLMAAVVAVFRDRMTYEEFQSAMWTLGGNQRVQELMHLLDAEHGDRVLSHPDALDVESSDLDAEEEYDETPALESPQLVDARSWMDIEV